MCQNWKKEGEIVFYLTIRVAENLTILRIFISNLNTKCTFVFLFFLQIKQLNTN